MSAESKGRSAAERFRVEHHLGNQPLGDLASLVEMLPEVDVAVFDSADTGSHGMTSTDPETGVTIIAVRATERPMRLRSSLAHELGHFVMKDSVPADGDWPDRSHEEIRADSFARHLLLPVTAIIDHLGDAKSAAEVTAETVSVLCQTFQVSSDIATIQLCNSGHIPVKQKLDWLRDPQITTPKLAAKFGWIPAYRSMQEQSKMLRPPQSLLARAIRGYEQGLVSIEHVARVRGVTVLEMQKELEEAGISPASLEAHEASELPPQDVSGIMAELKDLFGDDGDVSGGQN